MGRAAVYADLPLYLRVWPRSPRRLRRGNRPQDHVFTIMRDPLDIALSVVNYVLTRFAVNIEAGEPGPDTRDWLAVLRMEMPTGRMSDNDVREIGAKISATPTYCRRIRSATGPERAMLDLRSIFCWRTA